MCLSLSFRCQVCGQSRRSLVLDTTTETLTCFPCVGTKNAPPVIAYEPRDYDALDLSAEDLALIQSLGIRA